MKKRPLPGTQQGRAQTLGQKQLFIKGSDPFLLVEPLTSLSQTLAVAIVIGDVKLGCGEMSNLDFDPTSIALMVVVMIVVVVVVFKKKASFIHKFEPPEFAQLDPSRNASEARLVGVAQTFQNTWK